MAKTASNSTIQTLTDWWDDMGVDVDSALVTALLRANPSVNTGDISTSKTAKSAPSLLNRRSRGPKDWPAEARQIAAGCDTLEAIRSALEAFKGSPLSEGVEKPVIYDGMAEADLMLIGRGPSSDDDRTGRPFVGPAGDLLDKMLSAINCGRTTNTFLTNVNFWRPPRNRTPKPEELVLSLPFALRMVELVKPKLIVTLGDVPTAALLEMPGGIMKLRGQVHSLTTPKGYTVPLVPMLHPEYLLNRGQDKSRAWRDLLLIESQLTS
ncbi:MAG: uracil-DNA glycosylase [Hyphomonas sp.]